MNRPPCISGAGNALILPDMGGLPRIISEGYPLKGRPRPEGIARVSQLCGLQATETGCESHV